MLSFFEGKKIIVGICGGIASYKTPFLVRSLIKEGAEVKVIMTSNAEFFVTKLVLATLSKNPVMSGYSYDIGTSIHVESGLWADIFIVAPATLNTISKMANGICDNLLLATYFSSKNKNIFICPSMDLDMYAHPATKNNIDKLLSYQNHIIPAQKGELASGLYGEGRMAEPENIMEFIKNQYLDQK